MFHFLMQFSLFSHSREASSGSVQLRPTSLRELPVPPVANQKHAQSGSDILDKVTGAIDGGCYDHLGNVFYVYCYDFCLCCFHNLKKNDCGSQNCRFYFYMLKIKVSFKKNYLKANIYTFLTLHSCMHTEIYFSFKISATLIHKNSHFVFVKIYMYFSFKLSHISKHSHFIFVCLDGCKQNCHQLRPHQPGVPCKTQRRDTSFGTRFGIRWSLCPSS